jgi:predicted DNA-binding transcriptional regulator YafY
LFQVAVIDQIDGDRDGGFIVLSPQHLIEGIGRFYIGLASHIKILEGEELRKYAKEYAKQYLL